MMGEFYKMEYDAWDEGTVELSLEEEAAYLRLCHQIYRRHAPIPNSERLLCALWRCHQNRARPLLQRLIDKGKIVITDDGMLANKRALDELQARETLSTKRADAGHTGGIRSGHVRRHKGDAAHTEVEEPLKPNGPAEANASSQRSKTNQSRGEENTPPTPPPGGKGAVEGEEEGEPAALWEFFKIAWPTGSDLTDKTEKLFNGLAPEDQAGAVAGVHAYVREKRENSLKFTARRYLADGGWKGLKETSKPKDSGPKIPGYVIHPGSEEWEAWDAFLEQQGVYQGVSHSQIQNNNQSRRMMRVPSQWPPETAT
jgi:uncharacterized protein YdaU (DUF1376 family)